MDSNPQTPAEWEQQVLATDFTNPAHRTSDFLQSIPWTQLSRLTLYTASRRLTAATMSDPQSQQMQTEPDRALLQLQQQQPYPQQPPTMPRWLLDHIAPCMQTTRDRPCDRRRASDFPPTDDEYQDTRGNGVYTFGIKLSVLVADSTVMQANGQPLPDPHPQHPVKLRTPQPDNDLRPVTNGVAGLVITNSPEARPERSLLVRDIAHALNQTGNVVAATTASPDEDESSFAERVFRLTTQYTQGETNYVAARMRAIAEARDDPSAGRPPVLPENNPLSPETTAHFGDLLIAGITGALLPPDYSIEILQLTRVHLNHTPDGSGSGIRIHELSSEDIDAAMRLLPTIFQYSDIWDQMGARETDSALAHVRAHIEQRVSAARVDPSAYNKLRGTNRRYQAWRVAVGEGWLGREYMHNRTPPLLNPSYSWVPIEVSSPTIHTSMPPFRASAPTVPGFRSLASVCSVLKSSFRTHHCAVPELDLTTSIFISHSEGLTLLELKKLVTLWLVLEPVLSRLHRQRRCHPNYWPSGSLRFNCKLAGLVGQPLRTGGTGSFHDGAGIMPHPSDATRDFFTAQMHEHFNFKDVVPGENDEDNLFVRTVWQYASVSDLARAMEPVNNTHRLALAIRAQGSGQRTSQQRTGVRPLQKDIDAHRGVLEFRQMGQSLDDRTIFSWARICLRVLMAARETNPVTFRECIHMIVNRRHGDISVWDALGVPGDAMSCFGPEDRDADGFYHPRNEGDVDFGYPFYRRP
ncbi:hypothetical protein F4777DRAFT_526519 [Nemania sp. FL0916]|nr:hypothetical protein F4777DRAFT_526519 [Nemania sp. FL0916]